MSDEKENNNDKSELESLGAKPVNWFWGMDWTCGFLMKTHPSVIFVWGAVAIVGAGVFSYLSFQTGTGQMPGSVVSYAPDRVPSMGMSNALTLPAFLLGIIGALLPMWAVARLIADAVREGNKK